MKLLLTGPTGFIGSAVLRLALARGHSVAALVYPGETLRWPPSTSGQARWVTGTLADPPWAALADGGLDVCLHTAWVTTPGVYLEAQENERFLEWSRCFAANFFERGGRHFMGLGSCAEYRPARRPLSEEEIELNDTTRYARCKNALRLALEAMASGKRSICWGRVFYPFGVGEHPARLCSSLILKLSRGEPVQLKTPASTKDYIYIDDLAQAILLALERRFTGILNLGTGRGVTVREMAGKVADYFGRPDLVVETPAGEPDPLDYMVADARRLRSLGWREEVGWEKGVERLCRHLTSGD